MKVVQIIPAERKRLYGAMVKKKLRSAKKVPELSIGRVPEGEMRRSGNTLDTRAGSISSAACRKS